MIGWCTGDEVPVSNVIIYYALFRGSGVICYAVFHLYDNEYVTIMIIIAMK